MMKNKKLSKAITNVAYILDSLVVLRDIYKTGNCNECKTDCDYRPKPGQMVRYNCPFFEWEVEDD